VEGEGLVVVAAIVQILLLIVFLVMAANVGAIRRAVTKDPRVGRQCPYCLAWIARQASVCSHCTRESAAWKWHEGRWWVEQDGRSFWLDERRGQWLPVESAETPPSG
jgi:hypothetical protein